jgi:hypothetical protein
MLGVVPGYPKLSELKELAGAVNFAFAMENALKWSPTAP